MTRKSPYYALAVVLLMGCMAGVALADYNWTAGAYMPDSSVAAKPSQDMEPSAAGEIRGPVVAAGIPDSSGNSFKQDTGEAPTVEIGGRVYRPGIDLGE